MSEPDKELALLICRWCIYYDRIPEDDAFRTRIRSQMDKHYLNKHKINLTKTQKKVERAKDNPLQYGIINWNEKEIPLSKQLMFIKGNFPPLQLRVINEEKNKSIDLYLPSFPIMLENGAEVQIPVDIAKNRYLVRFTLEERDPPTPLPFYTLPSGFQGTCMECPMAYRKSFKQMRDFILEEDISKLDQYQQDIMMFKCDLNLCKGVLKQFSQYMFILIEKEQTKEEIKEDGVIYYAKKLKKEENNEKNNQTERKEKSENEI